MQYIIPLLSLFLLLASSQDNTYRIDLDLEYRGTVSWSQNTIDLTSTSETIQTLIDNAGQINYEVISRLRGAVSTVKGPITWVTTGQTFTATLDWSFGGSHINLPHILHTTTLGNGYVLPAHHEVLTSIAQLNITSGEGAFAGATGGVTINGYHDMSGAATWAVSAILWIPAAPPTTNEDQ